MLWINILKNIASLSCSANDSMREHPVLKLATVIHDLFSAAELNESLESSNNTTPQNWKRPKDSVAC